MTFIAGLRLPGMTAPARPDHLGAEGIHEVFAALRYPVIAAVQCAVIRPGATIATIRDVVVASTEAELANPRSCFAMKLTASGVAI